MGLKHRALSPSPRSGECPGQGPTRHGPWAAPCTLGQPVPSRTNHGAKVLEGCGTGWALAAGQGTPILSPTDTGKERPGQSPPGVKAGTHGGLHVAGSCPRAVCAQTNVLPTLNLGLLIWEQMEVQSQQAPFCGHESRAVLSSA